MNGKFRKQLHYVLRRSNFYKTKFKRFRRLQNLKRPDLLPFTTKEEILLDQAKRPPFGDNLCVGMEDILRIHKTSGTTNKPVIIAMTRNDIVHTVRIGSKCFRESGLTKKDVVVHCLNYNMWAGGYTDHQSLEATGAAVVPFGVGNSKVLIEMILQLKVTAIHCTPSYLAKLELLLREEFRLLPRDLKLRLGLFGAESGLQCPEFRATIEKIWGLKAMNANYGMSEVLSMFGAECRHQTGLHFMADDVLFAELIDPQTLKTLPIEKNNVGELVLTNLCREAQPLIRYRTGDVIKILGDDCRCKSNGFRFEIIGRSDDMLVIRGLNVFPSSIEQIINQYAEFVTHTYQILVNKTNPMNTIKLILELRKENLMEEEKLRGKIADVFLEKLNVRPLIDFVEEGNLPRTEGKSRQILRVL